MLNIFSEVELATIAITIMILFSPGPNEIFDRVRSFSLFNFMKNEKHPARFILQVFFCDYCTAVLIAVVLALIFNANFWLILAEAEVVALFATLKKEKDNNNDRRNDGSRNY